MNPCTASLLLTAAAYLAASWLLARRSAAALYGLGLKKPLLFLAALAFLWPLRAALHAAAPFISILHTLAARLAARARKIQI